MIRRIAGWLLRYELYFICVILFIFWYPDQNRVWALVLFIPLIAARLILYRRLWKPTPLDPLLVAFMVLCVINAFIAPYWLIAPGVRGLVMLGRPLMGMLLATSLIDRAYRLNSIDSLILPTIVLSLIVGILALVSSQWSVKSSQLMFIVNLLPKVRDVPQIGFNVNEIAGALAYLTPLMAGITVYYWTVHSVSRFDRWCRILATSAFCILWLAVFLGQSRFALLGILPMLLVISIFLVPRGRWRIAAIAFVVFFIVAQLVIMSGIFSTQAETLAERDQDSLSSRLLIWGSGLQILRDYPLTGSGMNTYRVTAVRALYPVPGFERIPHAHNEWIQIATDLGIPGLIVFAGWFVTLGWMLLTSWRQGDAKAKAIALGTACGLIAHIVYGMGDAVPVWDRFAFVFWWLVGLAGAQYTLVQFVPRTIENRLIAVKSS
jgi:O-antigen ligase